MTAADKQREAERGEARAWMKARGFAQRTIAGDSRNVWTCGSVWIVVTIGACTDVYEASVRVSGEIVEEAQDGHPGGALRYLYEQTRSGLDEYTRGMRKVNRVIFGKGGEA